MRCLLSITSGIVRFLAPIALAALAAAQSPSPVSGTVTAAGRPLAGVRVFSSAGSSALTGVSGDFRLDTSSSVLHLQRDGYQPLTLLVNPPQSGLRAQLQAIAPAAADSIPACAPLPPGSQRAVRRVGSPASGLQFTVPRRDWHVTELGGINLDEYILQPRHSRAQLTLWFGRRALPPLPDDTFFLQAADFSQRAILAPPRNGPAPRPVGIDSAGTLPGGARWRHFSTPGAGATYGPTDPSDAQLFDAIIASVCAPAAP